MAITLSILSVIGWVVSGGLQNLFRMRSEQAVIANRHQMIAQSAAGMVSGFIHERFSVLTTGRGA